MAKEKLMVESGRSKDVRKEVPKTPSSSQLAKELGVPETIIIHVDNNPIVCFLRKFSSGNKGYNANGKILIGERKCQVSGNVIIIGSKE